MAEFIRVARIEPSRRRDAASENLLITLAAEAGDCCASLLRSQEPTAKHASTCRRGGALP